MSVNAFLSDAEGSGLFGSDEIEAMKSKITRSRRTIKHITCTQYIIDETLRLCDKYAHVIAKHPELQAYLFERIGNIMLAHEQNKKVHAPELAKRERAKVDNTAATSDSEAPSSQKSALDRLKPQVIAAR